MKEKIRHLIAEKTLRRGFIKLMIHNLAGSGKLTEEIQNHYLDQLSALDEEIEILERALKKID
jgi:hypothetical protein